MGAENKELRARLEALEKTEGEGVQRGQGLPSRRESGLEEEWRVEMDLEDEAESRKKLDEQKKKLQVKLRDIENFSCVPKEFQESLKSNLQQQPQEVEQRRHDLMPEYQQVPKRPPNIQSIQGKRRNIQKRKCCSARGDAEDRNDFGSYRTKSTRTKWPIQKWRQRFRVCRQKKKRHQRFPSGGLLHGDDSGTVLRYGSRSGETGAEKERQRPLSNSPSRHSKEEDVLL